MLDITPIVAISPLWLIPYLLHTFLSGEHLITVNVTLTLNEVKGKSL